MSGAIESSRAKSIFNRSLRPDVEYKFYEKKLIKKPIWMCGNFLKTLYKDYFKYRLSIYIADYMSARKVLILKIKKNI